MNLNGKILRYHNANIFFFSHFFFFFGQEEIHKRKLKRKYSHIVMWLNVSNGISEKLAFPSLDSLRRNLNTRSPKLI